MACGVRLEESYEFTTNDDLEDDNVTVEAVAKELNVRLLSETNSQNQTVKGFIVGKPKRRLVLYGDVIKGYRTHLTELKSCHREDQGKDAFAVSLRGRKSQSYIEGDELQEAIRNVSKDEQTKQAEAAEAAAVAAAQLAAKEKEIEELRKQDAEKERLAAAKRKEKEDKDGRARAVLEDDSDEEGLKTSVAQIGRRRLSVRSRLVSLSSGTAGVGAESSGKEGGAAVQAEGSVDKAGAPSSKKQEEGEAAAAEKNKESDAAAAGKRKEADAPSTEDAPSTASRQLDPGLSEELQQVFEKSLATAGEARSPGTPGFELLGAGDGDSKPSAPGTPVAPPAAAAATPGIAASASPEATTTPQFEAAPRGEKEADNESSLGDEDKKGMPPGLTYIQGLEWRKNNLLQKDLHPSVPLLGLQTSDAMARLKRLKRSRGSKGQNTLVGELTVHA